MTGSDLLAARLTLGDRWMGRRFTKAEFGRLLGLTARDPSQAVNRLELGRDAISGPMALAVEGMLAGYQPANWRDALRED